MKISFYYLVIVLFLCSCANIIIPSGGEKDVIAPILLKTHPPDKGLNFKESKITFHFNENIQENKWSDFFYISPLLGKNTRYKINNKTATIFLEDTLENNTTYSLHLNHCIKDVNEGNILEKLEYLFSTSNNIDTLKINGKLIDAKALEPKINTWVFLQKEDLEDSLCFKTKPLYVTKSDENGCFVFDNLDEKDYKIFSISGLDFVYHEGDKLGFINKLVSSINDSNLTIYLFDPLYEHKLNDTKDSLLQSDSALVGNITITSNLDTNIIVQLFQDQQLKKEISFKNSPYIINDIKAGEYDIYLIVDNNKNNLWDTGSFILRKLPETIYRYKESLNIRTNWNLEIDWHIN
jgi:hypothetical protein